MYKMGKETIAIYYISDKNYKEIRQQSQRYYMILLFFVNIIIFSEK